MGNEYHYITKQKHWNVQIHDICENIDSKIFLQMQYENAMKKQILKDPKKFNFPVLWDN